MKLTSPKALLVLSVLLWFFACKSESSSYSSNKNLSISPNNSFSFDSEENSNRVIQVNKSKDEILAGDVFEIEELIPLETRKASLLGKVNKIDFFENQIFVLDAKNAKKLAVFDMDGTHQRNFGSKGGGPGQYSDILDFTIDREKKMVFILTFELDLLIYDIEGKIIDKHILKVPMKNIESLGNSQLALYDNDPSRKMIAPGYRLKIYDYEKKEIVSKHMYLDEMLHKRIPRNTNTFSKTGNVINLYTNNSDSVYQIIEDKISLKYFLDFGRHQRPTDFFENLPLLPASFDVMMSSNYSSPPRNWQESTRHIFMNYSINKEIYHTLISKKTQEVIFSSPALVDDFYSGMVFNPFGVYSDYFVCLIEPEYTAMFRNYYEKEGVAVKEKYPQRFKDLLSGLKSGDNPVIALLKVKEDIQ